MSSIFVKNDILHFHKIKFYNYDYRNTMYLLNKKKGYLVAPAASALIKILNNKYYYNSLKKSQVAIYDSGFFCILLRLFLIYKPTKYSGLKFFKNFINDNTIKEKKILLINSSKLNQKKNNNLLLKKKFTKVFNYISPLYKGKNIRDTKILEYILKIKPDYVITNISGCKQEVLAQFIIKNINFKCNILCIGAAIEFITGAQIKISDSIDKFYLGWFLRIMENPYKNLVRTFQSISLLKLMFKKKI
jgi:N-acetylglucosaminyldiphosphoundecaprenol N-acetyl-beta-D-mannosaminyltransferase